MPRSDGERLEFSFRVGGKRIRVRITDDGAKTGDGFDLRAVEAAAFKAAPGPTERPVSVKQLARLAGYSDTGHWREAVRVLVDRGLLVRVRGGVRRPA